MRQLLCAFATLLAVLVSTAVSAAPRHRCLSDCTPRIGIVSAFGAEADILLAQTSAPRTWTIHGKRFTTGLLALGLAEIDELARAAGLGQGALAPVG